MTHDARQVVYKCEVCQAAKQEETGRTTRRRRLYAERPWQVSVVDTVGPMPITMQKNKYILVLTDYFTRWSDALPIPDATAPAVARMLEKKVL